MLVEKSAAENAGGKKAFPAVFTEAAAKERKAEKSMQSGTREGLLGARAGYADARDGYTKVLAGITERVELKKDAEARRGEMNAMKLNVPGLDQERKTSPSFRSAATAEGQGHKLYQAGDYRGARDAYTQAGKLYSSAGNEIFAARSNAKPPVESVKPVVDAKEIEKKDPARKEKEEREAAQREIQRLLDTYRETMERGNLQGLTSLLNLNQEKQAEWSAFFGASEERKVVIDGVEMDVSRDNARVNFKVRMSFYNKAANTTQKLENMRSWGLELDNSSWKVITQK
jgi:tetratricopeptide (TPR) repeat protein